MSLHEMLAAMGINSTVLVAGGLGGVLRALSRKHFSFREAVAAPVCGALAAAYLTMPVVQYLKLVGWPVPTEDQQIILASAFLIGTCAMWISDMVFVIIGKKLKLTGE